MQVKLSKDRRCIERDAFNGRLLGIISTNALELGVDIGVLDAVIMLGFPLTVASFVSALLLPYLLLKSCSTVATSREGWTSIPRFSYCVYS
jgi:hypothetical protein